MENRIFIDRRRQGRDRREEQDLCEGLDVDIYHRKRRKKSDRRAEDRSLGQDYDAYMSDDEKALRNLVFDEAKKLH